MTHRLLKVESLTVAKAVGLAHALEKMSIQILDYDVILGGKADEVNHPNPGWNIALELGIEGLKDVAEKSLKMLMKNLESKERIEFLKSTIIVMDAATSFINRYGEEAKRLASSEKNKQRKKELEEIAKICQRISTKKPRSLEEARQLIWFLKIIDTQLSQLHTT